MNSGWASLHETGELIRRLFLNGEFPEAIRTFYRGLSRRSSREEGAVACAPSTPAGDLSGASFAGRQGTFLPERAISYRETKGFDHLRVALSRSRLRERRDTHDQTGASTWPETAAEPAEEYFKIICARSVS